MPCLLARSLLGLIRGASADESPTPVLLILLGLKQLGTQQPADSSDGARTVCGWAGEGAREREAQETVRGEMREVITVAPLQDESATKLV